MTEGEEEEWESETSMRHTFSVFVDVIRNLRRLGRTQPLVRYGDGLVAGRSALGGPIIIRQARLENIQLDVGGVTIKFHYSIIPRLCDVLIRAMMEKECTVQKAINRVRNQKDKRDYYFWLHTMTTKKYRKRNYSANPSHANKVKGFKGLNVSG